ncbi:MAG TPA: trigger factor [Actinomycetota bacterium]|nr:trigger factor [Actinomycetota bacterium]
MQTTLEEVDKHKVKLTVAVPPDEVRPVLDLAYRHIAGRVSVPGFRKGKVPRKIIDAQVGRDTVLQEFLEHALRDFYLGAVREHELAPIADPDFDDLDVGDIEGTGFRFTATVEVRPRLSFEEADYKGIRIDRPSSDVTEADVDEQLERLRDRFAELEPVGRPSRRGDYVVADIRAYVHDQEVAEASGQGVLYEVGSGQLVPELDQEIEGKRKGEILKFNAKLPETFGERAGQEVTFQILLKEVKAKVLPALDDDFARTASEFDSLDDLRADVKEKLGKLKEGSAQAALRDRALEALIDKVDVELPERLVDSETESRVQSARERADSQGVSLDQILEASGVDELQFRSDARAHALQAIKADLALEAVARAEGIQVSDEEVDAAVHEIAVQLQREPKDVRRSLERTGQITSLAGDIIRDKALNLVVERAEVVEQEVGGNR